jgi:hypothetical protein
VSTGLIPGSHSRQYGYPYENNGRDLR